MFCVKRVIMRTRHMRVTNTYIVYLPHIGTHASHASREAMLYSLEWGFDDNKHRAACMWFDIVCLQVIIVIVVVQVIVIVIGTAPLACGLISSAYK